MTQLHDVTAVAIRLAPLLRSRGASCRLPQLTLRLFLLGFELLLQLRWKTCVRHQHDTAVTSHISKTNRETEEKKRYNEQ